MTFFAPLLSVFITIVFSSLIFLGLRKSLTLELNRCINNATSIQIKHRKLTHKLLALNPLAKKLRYSRKIAEATYKVTPIYFKPAALAALQKVKTSQFFLRSKQLYIINKAFYLSLKSNASFMRDGYTPIKPSKGLEVIKVQKKSDSPDYRLKNLYERKKKIKYIKKISIFNFLPSPVIKFLNLKDNYKTLTCGSTMLKKGGKPWKTKLILDKL